MARVLITGASGLIGRRVLEAYGEGGAGAGRRGDRLIRIGRADDLLTPGSWRRVLDEHRPDVLVHLAWSASSTPDYRHHDENARWAAATVEAVELASNRGIHVLATGTSVDDVPADDAYSRSKAAARAALSDRIDRGELAWLRPFYVFDEEAPSPAVLRAALAAHAAGEPVALSSPEARHDFIHARDVGAAIRTAIVARLTGVIDIGSGAVATVGDLVESYGIRWVSAGVPSSAAASEQPGDVTALRAAGWTPVVTDRRFGRSPGSH